MVHISPLRAGMIKSSPFNSAPGLRVAVRAVAGHESEGDVMLQGFCSNGQALQARQLCIKPVARADSPFR